MSTSTKKCKIKNTKMINEVIEKFIDDILNKNTQITNEDEQQRIDKLKDNIYNNLSYIDRFIVNCNTNFTINLRYFIPTYNF